MIATHFVFSPTWWHQHYGVSFLQPFYLDAATRTENDVLMRRALYERFGYGEPDARPRPMIGSRHLAGGFAVPALLGVEIVFREDQAAWPLPRNLTREQAMALRVPDLETTWPMNVLLPQMRELKEKHGHVVGDLNAGGLLNTAVELRGQEFFIDLVEDPELADHILDVVQRTQAAVVRAVREFTGTAAVATNRGVLSANAALALTSNCSTHMISPRLYERRILPFEMRLAEALRPFGVHHCGSNLHKYAATYEPLGAEFYDVGWGSDVAAVSAAAPGVYLNLRMNPVRAMQCGETEIYEDALYLLKACGRRERVGLCCINMDPSTPDANVRAMMRAVADYEAAAE